MPRLEYALLDSNDSESVAMYERALFRAFYPMDDPLLERLRKADRGLQRMKLCIPYQDMDVFIARFDGNIIAGAAINYNCSAPMQLEQCGFTINKLREGVCEGLAIFNLRSFADHRPVMFELGALIHTELRRKKMKVIYGTCAPRLLKGYQLLGFREIAHRKLTSSTIHLLEKNVDSEGNGFTIDSSRAFRE